MLFYISLDETIANTYFLAPFYCSGQLTHCFEISGNKSNLKINVRQVMTLCPKSEVTLKVNFKQTVAMAIMKVHFRWAKCDHGLYLGLGSI